MQRGARSVPLRLQPWACSPAAPRPCEGRSYRKRCRVAFRTSPQSWCGFAQRCCSWLVRLGMMQVLQWRQMITRCSPSYENIFRSGPGALVGAEGRRCRWGQEALFYQRSFTRRRVGLEAPITVSYTPESVGIGYSSLVGNCLILRPKRQGQANAPRKRGFPPKN